MNEPFLYLVNAQLSAMLGSILIFALVARWYMIGLINAKDVIYNPVLVNTFLTVIYNDFKTSFQIKNTFEKTLVDFGRF